LNREQWNGPWWTGANDGSGKHLMVSQSFEEKTQKLRIPESDSSFETRPKDHTLHHRRTEPWSRSNVPIHLWRTGDNHCATNRTTSWPKGLLDDERPLCWRKIDSNWMVEPTRLETNWPPLWNPCAYKVMHWYGGLWER
jgi:hypothetical protein